MITLRSVLPLRHKPTDFKLHLACWNKIKQPLDVFVQDREEWKGWNEYRGSRNDFNRPYIFALIDFYHEPDIWLFGGIFRVESRHRDRYEVALDADSDALVGRLKVRLKRPARAKAVCLEKHYDRIVVSEILNEPYSGEAFCGYENINHDFNELESIFSNSRPDWKAALGNVKGVYLITDKSNGMRYVGAAHGETGIWARWQCYMETGHGWNDELTRLIKKRGRKYARRNFRFSLLEYRAMRTDDNVILAREAYWKEVLMTRGQFGYNKN